MGIIKILVTGGAGFIGSNFLYYMAEKYPHYNLHCVDKLTYSGRKKNIIPLIKSGSVVFYKMDIADSQRIKKLFKKEKYDIVINFAAESHVDRSISSPNIFIQTNTLGTSVLLNACLHYNVKRFHQVSTDEVYGDLAIEETAQFYETDALRPSSPYSTSKAAADLLALAFFRTYGYNVTITRCTNNFGVFQFPEKLIPKTIKSIMQDENIYLYGKGQNVRDWIYCVDHCTAIDAVIHKGSAGEIYNVGAGNELSNIDLVRKIFKILKYPEDKICFTTDRPGHDQKYSVNTDKIKNELGWTPKTDFDEGLIKTIEWYLSNPRFPR